MQTTQDSRFASSPRTRARLAFSGHKIVKNKGKENEKKREEKTEIHRARVISSVSHGMLSP
jgi:hypothetical protein